MRVLEVREENRTHAKEFHHELQLLHVLAQTHNVAEPTLDVLLGDVLDMMAIANVHGGVQVALEVVALDVEDDCG